MVSEAGRQLDLVAGSLRDAYLERGSASSPAALPAPTRGKTAPRLGLAGVLWHHTAARVCIAAESEPLLAEAARAIAGGSVATWLGQLAAEGPPHQGQQSAAKYAASFRALASALWREARLRAPQLVPVAATAYTTSLLLVAAAGEDAGYTDGDDAPDTLRGALAAMGDAQDALLADRTLTPLACASGTAPAGTQRSAAKAGVASSLHALAALECAATGDSAAARLRVAAARAATALTRTTTRGGAENGPVRPALVEWVEAGRPSAGAGAPALAASASLLDAIIDAASSSPWQPLCDAPLVAPLFVGAMSRAARLLACLGRGEKECGKPIQLARLAVRTAAEKSEVSSGSASLAFSAAKAAAYAAWAAVGARCAEAAAAAADEADPASKAWRRAASQGDGAAHVRTLVHRAATLAEEAAGHARSLTGEEGALGVDPHRPCTAAITQAFAALRDVLRWTEPCTRTLLAATHSVFDPGALPPVLTAPPDPGAGAGGTARVGPTATPAPQRGRTASRMSHAPATPAPPASAARSGRRSGARAAKTSVEEEEEEEGDAPAAALAVSSTPAPKARTAPREAREALGAFDALLSVGERAILGLVEALDAMGGGELSGGAAQCGALLRDAARLRLRLRLLPALSECDEEGDPVIARHTAAYATLCTKAAEAAVAAVAALAGSGPTDASLRREVQHVQALEHAMANDATAMYRDGRPALAAVPAAMAATLACLRCAVTASGGAESGAGAGGETAVGMGVCQTMDAAAARLELAALCASKPSGGKCGDARAAYATAAALHAAAHAVRGPMDPGEEPLRAGDASERLLGQAACQALAASLAAAPRAGSGPEAGSVENGDGAIAPLPLLVLQRLAPGRACRVADSDSHAAWSSALESLEQQCGMAPTPPAVGCASTFGATLALLSQAHPALHPRWAAACCAAASTAALARAASEGAAAVEAATRALTRAHPDGVAPRDVPGALERVATASGGERTTASRAAAAEHCWREACALWEDRHAAALGGDRRLARRLADTAAAAHALSLGRALAVAARLRGMDCLPSPHHAVLSPSPAALQQPSSVGAATVPADRAALPSLADALAALEGVGDALLDATVPFLQRAADEDGGGSKEEGEGDSAAAPLAAALAHCAALLRGGGSHGRPALAVAAVAGAVTGAAGDAAAATAALAVAEAVATSDGFHLNANSGESSRGAGAARRGRGGRPRDEDAAAATRWCEQAWSQAQGMPSLGDAASAAAAAWRGDRHVQEPFMELLALLASRASEAAAARGQVQLAFLTARLARAVVAPAHGWVGAAARLMVPAAALEPAQALAYLAEEAGGPGDLPDHASADAPRDGDGTGARVAALRQRLRAVLGQAGEPWSERLPWVLAQAAVVAEIPDVQAGGGGAVEEAPLGPDSAWTPLRALSAVAGGAQRAAAWQRLLTAGQGSTNGPDGELGQLVALLLARRPALGPGVGGMREGVGPGAPVLHSAGVTFTAAQGRRAQVPRAAAANVEGGNKDELDGTSSCESSPRGASPLRTGTRRALFAEPGPGPSSATPATPRARWAETTPGSAVGAGHSTPGLSSAPAEAGDDGEDGSSRAPPLDAADSARVLDILAALSATTSPEWGGSIAVATTLGAAAARAWHTALVRPTWSGVGAGAAGHGSSLSHAFTTVAWLWHVRGDADRALFYASQGVVVASACGDLVATTSALSRLALTAADAGLARLASEASAQCGEVVGLPSEPTASANAPPPGADTPPALAWALACLARGAATAPMEPIAGADREGDPWVRAARDAALGPQGMGAGGVDAAIRAVGLTRVGIAAEACSRLVARATAASCPVPADEADIARSLATALPSPAAHDLSAALIPGAERAEALAAAAKVVTAHSRGAAVSAGAVRVAGRYLAAWGGEDVWERVWCLAASIGPSHWLACARALGTHCGSDWLRVGDTASGLLAACLAAQQSAARDRVDSGLASALEAMTLEGGVATPGRNRGDGAQGPTPGLAALRDPLVALAALLPGAHVRSVPQEAMRARAGAMAATVGAWLPAHWRVVLMARAPDGALIIGGVQSSSAPYVVRVYVGGCAPVEETARLLEEAEEHARASASRARSLSSSEKREWWAARRTADEKLARLLGRTQQQWLGPWRALVMPTASSADDSERESGPSSSQGGAAEGEAVSECGQGPDAAALEALRCAVGPEGVTPCTVAAAAQVVRCVRQGHLGVWEGVCAVLALAGRLPVASPAAMGEAMREGWSVLAGVAGDVRAALAPGGTHGMAGEGGGDEEGEEEEEAVAAAAPAPSVDSVAERLAGWKVVELKAALGDRGLRKSGRKAELVARLAEAVAAEEEEEASKSVCSTAGRAPPGEPELDEVLEALVGEGAEGEEGAGICRHTGPAVLVVDEALQRFPWESLPCLAGADVTRLPAVPLLLGAKALSERTPATAPAPPHSPPGDAGTPSRAAPVDRCGAGVDRVRAAARVETGGCLLAPVERPQRVRRAVTVLNPGGDLKSTESALGPIVEECVGGRGGHRAWTAVAGRAPTESEMEAGVRGRGRVLVYCGHGTGGQYLSRARVERAPGDGVALLLGCSSARLRRAGDFDAAGAAVSHLLAGRSAVLGCLWDVTDGDLDRYSTALLRRWWGGGSYAGSALCASNREARVACKLRWLVGAAPVVYGLPVGPAQWWADGDGAGTAPLEGGLSGAPAGAGAATGGPPASCLKKRERRRRPRGAAAGPEAGSRRALAVRFAMMEE